MRRIAFGVIALGVAQLFVTSALADGMPGYNGESYRPESPHRYNFESNGPRYGGEVYTRESHTYERVEPRRVAPVISGPRVVEEPDVYPPIVERRRVVERPIVIERPIVVERPVIIRRSVVVEPRVYAYGPGIPVGRMGPWRHRGHFRDGY